MRLDQWRIEQGLNIQQLADRIPTTHTAAWRYCRGIRVPNRATMPAIYRVTAGQVQPNDFYDLPQLSEGVGA